MNRHTKHHIVNRRQGHGTTIGSLLLASLAVAMLLAGGITGGAGPARSGGKEVVRGEILPVEQTRTLYVDADLVVFDEQVCDIQDEDAAEDFGDYDNTIVAECTHSRGEASQQSSISSTYLSADGCAPADGICGGGHFGVGNGESVYEVVFDSSATQWCTLSGEISTEWTGFGSALAEVLLIGPGEIVLFQARLDNQNDTLPFFEEFLLAKDERYTLRAASEAGSDYMDLQGQYNVLLKLAAEGDIDGDGDVDTADLLALLGAWGPCEGCPEDIDGNGVVNTADLLILLGNWG